LKSSNEEPVEASTNACSDPVVGGGAFVAIVSASDGGDRLPRPSTATTVNV
jgi:hypothetical protein